MAQQQVDQSCGEPSIIDELSAGGQRVFLLVFVLMTGSAVCTMNLDSGVWALGHVAQAKLFGWISLKLSVLFVVVSAVLPALPAAFFYDYLTGQGAYAPKPSDEVSAAVSERELG